MPEERGWEDTGNGGAYVGGERAQPMRGKTAKGVRDDKAKGVTDERAKGTISEREVTEHRG